jgi:hypothetical protein
MKSKRFKPNVYRQSLWQTISGFFLTGKWVRDEILYIEISEDDPEYDSAPYQCDVIWMK